MILPNLEPANLSPTRSCKVSNLGSEWLGLVLVRGREEERKEGTREGGKLKVRGKGVEEREREGGGRVQKRNIYYVLALMQQPCPFGSSHAHIKIPRIGRHPPRQ